MEQEHSHEWKISFSGTTSVTQESNYISDEYVAEYEGDATGEEWKDYWVPHDIELVGNERIPVCDCHRFSACGIPCRHICALLEKVPTCTEANFHFDTFWRRDFVFQPGLSRHGESQCVEHVQSLTYFHQFVGSTESVQARRRRVFTTCFSLGKLIAQREEDASEDEQESVIGVLQKLAGGTFKDAHTRSRDFDITKEKDAVISNDLEMETNRLRMDSMAVSPHDVDHSVSIRIANPQRRKRKGRPRMARIKASSERSFRRRKRVKKAIGKEIPSASRSSNRLQSHHGRVRKKRRLTGYVYDN